MIPVSFGKKIPIALCQIQNKKSKEFSYATIYEHDAKDKEDIDYFKNLPKRWRFKNQVADNIAMKHDFRLIFENDRYFSIENKEGTPIGIMQINEDDAFTDIEYIESHARKRYSYIGTWLVAIAGIETLKKQHDKLIITDALKPAQPFYIKHCGFKKNNEILEMKEKEIKKFLKQTQKKTHSQIIDLRG